MDPEFGPLSPAPSPRVAGEGEQRGFGGHFSQGSRPMRVYLSLSPGERVDPSTDGRFYQSVS